MSAKLDYFYCSPSRIDGFFKTSQKKAALLKRFMEEQMTHKKTNNYYLYLGFSLIELMVGITIALIIMGISIPSFAGLMSRNKVTLQTNSIFQSLYLARSYAITEQKHVHVCHMSQPNSMQCHQQKGYNSTWSNGWLVFVDKNNDNEYDDDDKLVKAFQSINQTNIVFNQQGRLRFFPDGSSRSAGFYICDQQQQAYRHVYLLHTGRARTNQSLTNKQKAICDAA